MFHTLLYAAGRTVKMGARNRRLALASKRLLFGSSLKNGCSRFGRFCVCGRRSAPLSRKFRIHSALIGIFLTVDRRKVRRIFIEIGSSDPIFLAGASIHFHKISLEIHRLDRFSPLTLTTSTASP
jgi:hypothetical protein